jgi:hypothetical protein
VEVPADPFISPEHNVAQNGGLTPANVPHAVRDTISVLKLPVAVTEELRNPPDPTHIQCYLRRAEQYGNRPSQARLLSRTV